MKIKQTIYFLLFVALIGAMLVVGITVMAIVDTQQAIHEYNMQEEQAQHDMFLHQLDKRLNQIEESKKIAGEISFYDYSLDSGWSSVGHMVCATRFEEWRYKNVRVTNLDNGNTVVCRQTDYGPDESVFPKRVADLSSTAFAKLAPLSEGIVKNAIVELVDN